MEQRLTARVPLHLWVVGILALLWNGFGCYDYFMTRTRGADYVRSMMPGMDADAIMAYINGFPLIASAAWGLGVWGGLAGSILLLIRNRHAVTAFALSMIGAVVGLGWQLLNPAPVPDMHQGINALMPYLIIAVAVGQFLYARAIRVKGLLV